MNKITLALKTTALASLVFLSTTASARDDQNMYPLKDALETSAAQEKLDTSIKLYFGKQKAPGGKNLGEWKTNKKTNAFNKSDKEACEWLS